MVKNMLAPGLLFRPTDTQLVNHYLKSKVLDEEFHFEAISQLDVYKFAPWDLPYKSCLNNEDLKWYFFSPVERRYARRTRSIRATEYGYWKVIGRDKPIYHNKQVVGMKKTMLFYFCKGKGYGGDQTDWVMNEYSLVEKEDAYVLCVVGQAVGGYKKAEDVVSTMLAKGFIIGKDAVNKAKVFDEKHRFTSTASAKIASLDHRIGFTEKFCAGTTMVNEKMWEVDQKFRVSEKTKSAFAAAEQSVGTAGCAIMKNPYVSVGASWVSAAYNRVAKAAEDVGQKIREKVLAEEQSQIPEGHPHINESNSPKAANPECNEQPSNPSSEQGLINEKTPLICVKTSMESTDLVI